MVFELAVIIYSLFPAATQECRNPQSAPALDHSIVAVHDLDAASAAFRRAGFRIKPGRLHAKGLLNRHIKFRDGSEVELMTVQGEPRDEMARDYAVLLRAGDGGVYVALRVRNLSDVTRAAAVPALQTSAASGTWQFVSFPPSSPAAAVFFSSGSVSVQDPDSIFAHQPPVTALAEAWLEGGAALPVLLRELGAEPCGRVTYPDGRSGERWMLSRGSVIILPVRAGVRPRLLGVVLESAVAASTRQILPEFWVRYR